MLEADLWCGTLFANLCLTRTHAPICLATDLLLLQLHPTPRHAYADEILDACETTTQLDPVDWTDCIRNIVQPNDDPNRAPGSDVIIVRKRRKFPMGMGQSGGRQGQG